VHGGRFLRYCRAIENIFIKYRPHTESGGSRGFVLRPMKAGKGGKKGGTRRNRKKRKNSPGSILNCGKKKGGKERRWKKEEIEEGEPGALRNDSMLTIKWDFQYLPGKYYGDIRRSSRRMNPLFSRIISILSISRFRVRSNMQYRWKIILLYRLTRHRVRESFHPYNFRIARNLKYLSSRRVELYVEIVARTWVFSFY